jgi:hypothetical protein
MQIDLDEPKVNDLGNYTTEGITHAYILDSGQAYELIDGEWVEKTPF